MGQRSSQQLFKSYLRHSKDLTYLLLFILYFTSFLLSSSCANQAAITGGPKDSLAPELLNTVPLHKSINFKGQQIVLVFNERIQAPQIQRKLIVTPLIEITYKTLVKKNELRLTFDEPFGDSTTYTFNFSDAVEDITEKLPAKNVVLAFSTGDYIDSMYVSGNIYNLLDNEPVLDAVVALYHEDDTLDIFTGKPTYFALTDSAGGYSIENIKNGTYNIYAFVDENRNLTNESSAEPHGFLTNPIQLEFANSDSTNIPINLSDVRPVEISRERTIGQYYEVRFNKYVHGYSLQSLVASDSIPASNLVSNNEILRLYPTIQIADSNAYELNVYDSIGHQITDTIYVKFDDNQRRPEPLEVKVFPINQSDVLPDLTVRFSFNKPILQFNTDSLFIKYDSLRTDVFDTTYIVDWNWNRTELSINKKLDPTFLPDTLVILDSIKRSQQADTTQSDQTVVGEAIQQQFETVAEARSAAQKAKPIDPKVVSLYVGKGAFVTVDNDSIDQGQFNYRFINSEDYGIIRGTVETSYTSYIVQLIDDDYKVIKTLKDVTDYQFSYITPGKYSFRVLIDANEDGEWFPGNSNLKIEPEPLYFFPMFFDIRANWELEDINLTF